MKEYNHHYCVKSYFVCLLFQDRDFLCSLCCSGTSSIDWADLDLLDPPESVFFVLEKKGMYHIHPADVVSFRFLFF